MSKKYTIHGQSIWRRWYVITGGVLLVGIIVAVGVSLMPHAQLKIPGQAMSGMHFEDSVSTSEKAIITKMLSNQKGSQSQGTIAVKTDVSEPVQGSELSVYVPVTNYYDARLQINKDDLKSMTIYVLPDMDKLARQATAQTLGVDNSKLVDYSGKLDSLPVGSVLLLPVSQLSTQVKLLRFSGDYYLDSFTKGAVFRYVTFGGVAANNLTFNNFPTKDNTLKVNMTGVTALTRLLMKKLDAVKDPTYFSQQIGQFLADADVTHISDEVSFKPGCVYSHTVFCAPPEMLETLKASGIDLVELTGNHNNDNGDQYNTETINAYHKLGWHTFGGGLNSEEASKPYLADIKGSKVAFLGYNYADSPNGGPIATSSTAGSNSFDLDKIKHDIELAHQQSKFVIVDVQFFECYAYPDGYVEFPECDGPIAKQQETFRAIIDAGADMVIGTQAHQPQTYELYNGKPIYYGLGNLYFDQIQWPGTERGIILTHYFHDGKLLQTKLSPTVYDQALQVHLMSDTDAVSFLGRLIKAKP